MVDVDPAAFCEWPASIYLIDVRSAPEYAQFHAPRAKNLSLQRLLLSRIPGLRRWVLPAWFEHLPKEAPIAVICLTAHRSPIAAQQLVHLGFQQVFNITGGMMAWRRLGLPTCR